MEWIEKRWIALLFLECSSEDVSGTRCRVVVFKPFHAGWKLALFLMMSLLINGTKIFIAIATGICKYDIHQQS